MTNLRALPIIILLAIAVAMVGCRAGGKVQPVATAPSAAGIGDELATVSFVGVAYKLKRGDIVGYFYGDTGWSGCWAGANDAIVFSASSVAGQDSEKAAAFAAELKAANYSVVGDAGTLFETDDRPADYWVGATVESFTVEACREYSAWSKSLSGLESGTGRMKVTWQVYSPLDEKVIYETTTEGSSERKQGTFDVASVLFEDSFAAAAANLAADRGFHDLLAGNGESGQSAADAKKPVDEPVMTIAEVPAFEGGITANLTQIKRGVVVVKAAGGHGSGFFISDDLILTNHHVAPGKARYIVVLHNGKEVEAEYLRSHRQRDIALLRVKSGSYRALPLRFGTPKPLEDVYVIGAPLDADNLRATITKGIVNDVRTDDRTGLKWLQSNVEIHEGNSGGPVLDADGNVLGLATSVRLGALGETTGISFAVPIEEGLKLLRIRRSGAAVSVLP